MKNSRDMKLLMNKTWSKNLNGLWCGLVLLVGMSACDLNNDSQAEPDEVAYVSLYNAAPDSPDLDIIVDNRQINSNPFDYADYTGYLRFYTGDRNLRFTPYTADNVVLDTTVTFEPQKAYSVFVIDEYPDLEVLILNDPFDAPAEENARVRVVNLSPDSSELEVFNGDQEESLFEPTVFKGATDFEQITADEYDLIIKDTQGNVELEIPDVTLQKGWFYTIVIKGYEDPEGDNSRALSAEIIVN